ncbi:hypothetical protein DIPPA_33674 [Diplonema papillatum]|nr:hypothetical protein DIPPA_33674 [Diplonema papillatum]
MPPKQNAGVTADELMQLEKRLVDLGDRLAAREAELEKKEAEDKRKREQDETDRVAKRRRLPEEGENRLVPTELMPGLTKQRAEEIFLAFQDENPSFWDSLNPGVKQEILVLVDEREVLAVLDEATIAAQAADVDGDDDDFVFLDVETWKTMAPTPDNLARFEGSVRRLYRLKGNPQLQDRRDDVTEKIRDLVRLRRGETGPPKAMWLLRLGLFLDEYEQLHAAYETRDPGAAGVMRQIQQVDRLPERVKQARRRFSAQFKSASRPARARLGRAGPSRENCINFRHGRCTRQDCRFRHTATPGVTRRSAKNG